MRTLPKFLLAISLLTVASVGWAACPEGTKNNYKGECVLKDSKDIFGGNWSASSFERSLNNKPYGHTVVPMPDAPTGKFVHRFELRPGDCAADKWGWDDCQNNRERSELNVKWREWSQPGDDVWYQWWFKVDQSWRNPSTDSKGVYVYEILGQVHEYDPTWCAGCRRTVTVFLIETDRDGLRLYHQLGYAKRHLLTNEELKDWHQITVHVKWSQSSDGVMELWVDDKKKYDWQGQTTTTDKTYFKFGIYRNGKIGGTISTSYTANHGKMGRLIDNAEGLRTSIVYYDQVTRSNTPLIRKAASKRDSAGQVVSEPVKSKEPIEAQKETDQQVETTTKQKEKPPADPTSVTSTEFTGYCYRPKQDLYYNTVMSRCEHTSDINISKQEFASRSIDPGRLQPKEAEAPTETPAETPAKTEEPLPKEPLALPTTPEYLVMDVQAFLKVNPTLPELVAVMQKTLALKAAIAQHDQAQTKGRYDQLVEIMEEIEGFATFQKARAQQRQAGTAILKQGKTLAVELRQYLVDHMDAVNIEQLLTTLATLEGALGQGDIETVRGLIDTASTAINVTATPSN